MTIVVTAVQTAKPVMPHTHPNTVREHYHMNIIPVSIPDLLVIEPKKHGDDRGFFYEIYQEHRYRDAGILGPFFQDNISRSSRGVLRGLHFQNPNAQGKLVTVLAGAVLDIAVDIRRGSPTFGHHVSVELSDQNRRQFWIPAGFAHGFRVLSATADFFYKCDGPYRAETEHILKWNDPDLGIDWGISDPRISEKDGKGLALRDLTAVLPNF